MLASVNTMSTGIRKYEQRARAASQQETRERIARAAAELHEQVGVAGTTVAEIARRAGVSRLTVYNHFEDLEALLPACAAHYEAQHPLPDLAPALEQPEPRDRVAGVLRLLYGWFRETRTLQAKVLSERTVVPELDRFLAGTTDRMLADLADALADGLPSPSAEQRALLALAVDFWTWTRLDREGLDDDAAARLMARTALPTC